jgi:hypothetical protein
MSNKDALRKALQDLLAEYVKLVQTCVPVGIDIEQDPAVVQARAALARFSKPLEG